MLNGTTEIVEFEQDLDAFAKRLLAEDCAVFLITVDHDAHPVNNRLAGMFFHFLESQSSFMVPFAFDDAVNAVPGTIWDLLRTGAKKKYVLDKKTFMELCPGVPENTVVDLGLIHNLAVGGILPETLRLGFNKPSQTIPLVKHMQKIKEALPAVCGLIKNHAAVAEDNSFRHFNSHLILSLAKIEQAGLKVDKDKLLKHFGETAVRHLTGDNIIRSQYNIYTRTGRPSNRFGGVNYAALNKEDGSRGCFISRFGREGALVEFDFESYHFRLLGQLLDSKLPTEPFHMYMAKMYLGKETISEQEYNEAKAMDFHNLYGKIPDELLKVEFWKQVQDYINFSWAVFQEQGFVNSVLFGRKITPRHIEEFNPGKLFNYIIQLYETEQNIVNFAKIFKLLENCESKFVLYTYDSFLIDTYLPEKEVIRQIKMELETGKNFPVKIKAGANYHELRAIPLF